MTIILTLLDDLLIYVCIYLSEDTRSDTDSRFMEFRFYPYMWEVFFTMGGICEYSLLKISSQQNRNDLLVV